MERSWKGAYVCQKQCPNLAPALDFAHPPGHCVSIIGKAAVWIVQVQPAFTSQPANKPVIFTPEEYVVVVFYRPLPTSHGAENFFACDG